MGNFCMYCGAALKDGDRFCMGCGAKVAAPAQAQAPAPAPEPKPAPATVQGSVPGPQPTVAPGTVSATKPTPFPAQAVPTDTFAGTPNYADRSTFSTASGKNYQYVVLQVTLKEKFFGTGSGNLTELEECINAQAAKGYRLHTISTSNGGSKGVLGGDRIQATLVFEKVF